jgi:hypothetical protein
MQDRTIAEALALVGVPTNLSGYKYLKIAISRVLESDLKVYMYKDIYCTFEGEDERKVESAIRYAVQTSLKNMSKDVLKEVFKTNSKEHITNARFIYTVAEYIKMEEALKCQTV